MALIELVKPEQAEGKVKESYGYFMELASMVPLPAQMLSVSPDLLSIQIDTMKYYIERSGLSFSLNAHIRLLVAHRENYPYCVNLNSGILATMGGLSREQIESAIADPGKAALEKKEVALLQFVLKAVHDPASTDKSDIEKLHGLGWTDRNIFDAVNEGMQMVTRGMMFKAFKIGEA